MKIKKHIECSIDILDNNYETICTISNGAIHVAGKEERLLSIKAAYYVVNYTPDTDIFQQFTIIAKCNDYYYDCTINTITGDKSLLVRDSYHNNILVIDGNVLKEAIDSLFRLEDIYKNDNENSL